MPDTDDYFGREEFLRGTLLWHEEWESFTYRPLEFRDIGERVLIRVRLSGRGSSSGVESNLTLFHLWSDSPLPKATDCPVHLNVGIEQFCGSFESRRMEAPVAVGSLVEP